MRCCTAANARKGQVQAWALNRYYYQAMIPLKDASLIARCDDPALRREWRKRLIDHDGERRRRRRHRALAQAHRRARARSRLCGLAARACCRRRASRSTPMCISCARRRCSRRSPPRSPSCSRRRSSASEWRACSRATNSSVRTRSPISPGVRRWRARDSEFALAYVKRHASTPDAQQSVLGALEFKCDVLWAMLDALYHCLCRAPACPARRFRAEGLSAAMNDARTDIDADARPRLPRGVRLVHNEAQGGWVLLAPERVFKADAIAAEILKRCTGAATFAEIVDDLAKTYGAPRDRSPGRCDHAVARACGQAAAGVVIAHGLSCAGAPTPTVRDTSLDAAGHDDRTEVGFWWSPRTSQPCPGRSACWPS